MIIYQLKFTYFAILCLNVSTIFDEGAYLTFKSIFHKALKDGSFAILKKGQCFTFNVEC